MRPRCPGKGGVRSPRRSRRHNLVISEKRVTLSERRPQSRLFPKKKPRSRLGLFPPKFYCASEETTRIRNETLV